MKLPRAPDGSLQPQALVDASGVLHLAYLKGDPRACDVFYTRRAAGTTNFSAPLRVNSEPGSAIAIGTIRGAQLALGRNGRVHVAWNGSGVQKSGRGAPMLYARLNDAHTAFEILAMWEKDGQVYDTVIAPPSLEFPEPQTRGGKGGARKHPVIARATAENGSRRLTAWTEGTGWQRGGSLAWELTESNGGRKTTGRAPGVPVWSRIAAVAEADGTFTIIY